MGWSELGVGQAVNFSDCSWCLPKHLFILKPLWWWPVLPCGEEGGQVGRFPSGQHELTNFSRENLGALEASEEGSGETGGRDGWAVLVDRTSEWWLRLMARSLSQAPNPTT